MGFLTVSSHQINPIIPVTAVKANHLIYAEENQSSISPAPEHIATSLSRQPEVEPHTSL